jgi:hypothetical protein
MRFVLTLIYIFSLFSFVYSQDIGLNLVNKSLVNNTWTFDLQMTIIQSSGGNWGTMNIRNNIVVPDGIFIDYAMSNVSFTPGGQLANGTVSSFTGGNVAGTAKLSLNFERNASSPDLPMGAVVNLATFTIVFSDNVSGSNLITPRPFASTGSGASFWVDIDDPSQRREFNLYPIQPLPITLKSFDAIKHSASSAKLDWTTSKEVNSDYFGIERSIDGSTWDEIARVKAAGDSNVDIAYDYIDDRLPLSRTNGQVFYYRLRMTDLDGAFKYSDVRGVNFDKQALGPISIYPNPTTEIVNIDLSEVVMEDGDVYVSVYDMSGRLVMTKQIIGSGIELIKVDQLPSDAYNFIIRQGEQIHQQRVIKID